MKDALNDASVDHVVIMAVEGGYNCTEEDIPPHSIVIKGRDVLLEGSGPDIYIDVSCGGGGCGGCGASQPVFSQLSRPAAAKWDTGPSAILNCWLPSPPALLPACVQCNKVNNQVQISDGGNLTQRNFWADDCLNEQMPYLCFGNVMCEC
jgi:hypothetical protein